MNRSIQAVVLAGGGGTRLWPLSREEVPKQFLSLGTTEGSLLQETLKRLLPLCGERIRVVAGNRWRSQILFQAHEIGMNDPRLLIEEPTGRNTAPAIALALAALLEEGLDENTPVLVCPSDHVIRDEEAFRTAVVKGLEPLEEGRVVTFGIVPRNPETGFGYIRKGADRGGWYESDGFTEKPDSKTAEKYLEAGCYLWNGGIFLFRLSDMVESFNKYLPEVGALLMKGRPAIEKEFETLPSISIDHAVMERTERVAVVPMESGWTDLGSWDALYGQGEKDDNGNLLQGDIIETDCRNCLIRGNSRLIAASGLDDTIVVDSPDALFITRRGISQNVRMMTDRLKEEGRSELWQAPESTRQWGEYRILYEDRRVKIKRILVHPGKNLSLQYHHHRSEHWIIVSGTAKVHRDGEEFFLKDGESTFISKGQLHRLSNPGDTLLEIIEVQNGSYLGEDDIVRVVVEQ